MGKDKKTFKMLSEQGETIFNIAAYNCSRNYIFGGKNSKHTTSQVAALTNYIDNLPETSKK